MSIPIKVTKYWVKKEKKLKKKSKVSRTSKYVNHIM